MRPPSHDTPQSRLAVACFLAVKESGADGDIQKAAKQGGLVSKAFRGIVAKVKNYGIPPKAGAASLNSQVSGRGEKRSDDLRELV